MYFLRRSDKTKNVIDTRYIYILNHPETKRRRRVLNLPYIYIYICYYFYLLYIFFCIYINENDKQQENYNIFFANYRNLFIDYLP